MDPEWRRISINLAYLRVVSPERCGRYMRPEAETGTGTGSGKCVEKSGSEESVRMRRRQHQCENWGQMQSSRLKDNCQMGGRKGWGAEGEEQAVTSPVT